MSKYESTKLVKEPVITKDFPNVKQWFVDNNLYDILERYQPNNELTEALKITFTRTLTADEEALLLSKFPEVSKK